MPYGIHRKSHKRYPLECFTVYGINLLQVGCKHQALPGVYILLEGEKFINDCDNVAPCLLETPANGRPEPYEHGEISVNFFILSQQNLKINVPQ